MKKLLILLMICVPSYAQEVTKDEKGRTVITLDEKASKECEKQGCLILPTSVIEYLVKEYASQLCGKRI